MKGLTQAALATSQQTERDSLYLQFTETANQMTSLANDSSYRGTNLNAGQSLTINFNPDGSTNLTVSGFDNTATGLGITTPSSASQVTTLRTWSKVLSNSLNIISAQTEFNDSMVSLLQAGSDKLTLADMNEEAANMLMLQTRQSLGTTSLNMGAQTAQSVMRLF